MLTINSARIFIAIAATFAACLAAADAPADETPRLSVTTQNTKSARDSGLPGKTSENAFEELQTSGDRHTGKRSNMVSKAGAQRSAAVSNDFWFYSADVVLFNDHDQDGHFHGIDLLFDADTYYADVDVYAVTYLSLDGGPWNEYFATDNFTLFGTSADDEFNIVSELVSGYPTGSYDLLIELFDAYDDAFLASFGPVDTSELAFLPLEDSNRDVPVDTTVVVVEDGGGSLGWLTLLVLLAAPRVFVRRSPGS